MTAAEALDHTALARWQANPVSFIEEVIVDPATKRPFELLPAERLFLEHAFKVDDDGRLLYPEQVYACPKKSGKTSFAAMHALALTLLFGEAYPEATICANDQEQAQGRVFEQMRRMVESSPVLRGEARITQDKITFPALNATITAIPSSYATAAGGNQNISVFDELWAFTSERSRRLWDELVPPPTRKIGCRLTTTYAGFEGESALLQELYRRGLEQPLVGPDLHAGDGLLMFWSHVPIAPWQSEIWIEQMRRSLRPAQFLRMIKNQWVSSESTFIDMRWWDECVHPDAKMLHAEEGLSIWVGIDASVKHDSTAVVAVTWDRKAQAARLVWHRIFQPSPDEPLDFEKTVERAVLDLRSRFLLRLVMYDPYQMAASAQRLARAGVRLEEFPQTTANLTEASQNLFELIKGRNLVAYPDAGIRLAVSRAVAIEGARGWRIAKEKQSHRIDVVVALGMACLGAVRQQGQYAGYDVSGDWICGPTPTTPEEQERRNRELAAAMYWSSQLPPGFLY
jgi:phage terminase large subunit-like protein